MDKQAVANAIADHMEGWYVEKVSDAWTALTDRNGHRLLLDFNGPRLHVCGVYQQSSDVPNWGVRAAGRGVPLPAISVALSRKPGAIANDIQRRLLPEYLALYDKAQSLKDAAESYINTGKAAGQQLQAAGVETRTDPTTQEVTFSLYAANGSHIINGRCHGDKVAMELRGLTVEKAVRIINILKEAQ